MKNGRHTPWAWALVALLVATAAPALADGDDWCKRWKGHKRGWHCEVRQMTVADGRSLVGVDAGANGGGNVTGWDRNEIRIEARVAAEAGSDEEAREIASKVRIETAGTIQATGPRTVGRRSWSVSFRVHAPASSDLDLEAKNGGLSVQSVSGEMHLQTTNGGLSLKDLAGDVHARTTNGGVSVKLTGSRWQGEGLDARTTNGGVQLDVPEGYDATLETGTVNGSTHVDFPITVQGKLGKRFTVELGEGGPPIRVVTTNGSVRIGRP